MISYEPLRKALKERGLSPNKLYENGIITTNVATAINNDRSMSLANLEKICKYLDIKPGEAIVFK